MNNNFFDVLAKLDQIEKSITESARPDYIDLDRDGDKNEPMTQAAQDKKQHKEVDGGIWKSARKMTKWDRLEDEPAYLRKGRGEEFNLRNLNIGEPEHFGPKPDEGAKPVEIPAYIRKKQGENFPVRLADNLEESQQLDECGMTDGSMSPMHGGMTQENQGRLNISSNYDSESGRKSLTVTAEGDQAEELAQMLKLSGMMGGTGMDSEHPRSMNIVGSMDAEGAEDLAKMLRHSGLQEAYANEPDEKVESTEKILHQGNDLNRKKKQHADKPKLGDNPLATENRDKSMTESLEQRLWAEFQREKAR